VIESFVTATRILFLGVLIWLMIQGAMALWFDRQPICPKDAMNYKNLKRGRKVMKVFDLVNLESMAYEQREKKIFFQNDLFKTKVIDLKPGQKIPDCQMDCFVMFYVVKGKVLLRKNDESATLKENQVCISEPALFSMETIDGARLMGVQIETRE